MFVLSLVHRYHSDISLEVTTKSSKKNTLRALSCPLLHLQSVFS